MTKIALVSDTTSDIPLSMRDKLDVSLADCFVHFGTETYRVNEMPMADFYSRMNSSSDANFPKTSQPKASDFLEIYERLKAEGHKEILSIHVSSHLSGTMNSANVAKGMIDEVDIRVVDSCGVSSNLVAVLQRARLLIDKGLSLDDIEEELDHFSHNLASYITFKSLDNLVKGGRISKLRYRFGNLLKIKPILQLKSGMLTSYDKARGEDRARNKIFDIATANFTPTDKIHYIIAHTRIKNAAESMEKQLKEKYPKSTGFIMDIGIVVAVHGGEGAMLLLVY